MKCSIDADLGNEHLEKSWALSTASKQILGALIYRKTYLDHPVASIHQFTHGGQMTSCNNELVKISDIELLFILYICTMVFNIIC